MNLVSRYSTQGCDSGHQAHMATDHIRYDLFVAAPMAAFKSEAQFNRSRRSILSMIGKIREQTSIQRIYYAGESIGCSENFDQPMTAFDEDLSALTASAHFLLIYPEKIATGALVELGYAIAEKKPVLILTRDTEDLPYFLKGSANIEESALSGPIRISAYKDDVNLAALAIEGLHLIGACGFQAT